MYITIQNFGIVVVFLMVLKENHSFMLTMAEFIWPKKYRNIVKYYYNLK